MRIALITPGFSASEADWCIPALLNLTHQLAERHDVAVFALRYPHRRGVYRVYGAEVTALGGSDTGGLARGALLARALSAIVSSGRGGRFDIIHGFWADEAGALAVAAGRLMHSRTVVSLMGGELVGDREIGYGVQLSEAGRRLVKWSLANAGVVTVGSQWLAVQARRHVAANRLVLAPLGVDTHLFNPYGPAEALQGAPRLLHVASLAPVKDQGLLLQAVATMQSAYPGTHLHVVGEGHMRASLEIQAAALGITSRVTFHGAVRHELLPGYYRGADVMLMSSRFESQNMAVLEAAACGCAVVGTAVGILPELLPPAALAPPGSPEALAVAAAAACRDPDRVRRLGTVLRTRVAERYALAACVPALERIYTNCQP